MNSVFKTEAGRKAVIKLYDEFLQKLALAYEKFYVNTRDAIVSAVKKSKSKMTFFVHLLLFTQLATCIKTALLHLLMTTNYFFSLFIISKSFFEFLIIFYLLKFSKNFFLKIKLEHKIFIMPTQKEVNINIKNK